MSIRRNDLDRGFESCPVNVSNRNSYGIFDPFRNLGFVNDNVSDFVNNVKSTLSNIDNALATNLAANMDIIEDTDKFEIIIELPGVIKENIKIVVNDENTIEIEGKKETCCKQEDCENKKILRSERKFGEFSRTVKFNKMIDKSNIVAKWKNGELFISIPKAVAANKSVEIAIE